MPLDSNKIAHIQSVILKSFAGRQKPVVFVYQVAGVYTYTIVQAIFRPQTIINPEIPDISGSAPRPTFDLLMIAPISTNFSGVVFVADTATANASAIAAAAKYEVVEALPIGIVPGGTHIAAKMRRFR
jgi:flavoprotein